MTGYIAPVLEFVTFDKDGTEVDWIDPYVTHDFADDGRVLVSSTYCDYLVAVPKGGRYEVRPLKES